MPFCGGHERRKVACRSVLLVHRARMASSAICKQVTASHGRPDSLMIVNHGHDSCERAYLLSDPTAPVNRLRVQPQHRHNTSLVLKRRRSMGYPPHLLQIPDGRERSNHQLMCRSVFSVLMDIRKPDFSIRAVFSDDEGRSWDIENTTRWSPP
jgi:hypothetical protein